MRNFIIISVFFSFTFIFSQERQKIDGVAAVIGDFVVLESDIEKQFTQLRVWCFNGEYLKVSGFWKTS